MVFFDFLSSSTQSHTQQWGKWTSSHDSSDQASRLKRATKADNTPTSLNAAAGQASFSGSHGTYNTTLSGCTCVDFGRRKLPCKHMYRLAIELGLMDLVVETDKKAVVPPIPQNTYTLEQAVAILEKLDDEAQKCFLFYCSSVCQSKNKHTKMICSDALSKLVDVSLLTVTEGNITVDKNVEVIQSPMFMGIQKNIHTYLKRKYDTEEYYDPETDEWCVVPYGSLDSISISIEPSEHTVDIGEPKRVYLDDEVSTLLYKYGHLK